MLYIGLFGVGLALILPNTKHVVDLRWYVILGIIFGEIFLLFIAGFISDWIADLIDRIPANCPKCRASIVQKGTGFYDFSLIPHFTDIFTTILFLVYNSIGFFILIDLAKK